MSGISINDIVVEAVNSEKVQKIEKVATEATFLPLSHKFGEKPTSEDYLNYINTLRLRFKKIIDICYNKEDE